MPQYNARKLREACAIFTPGNWAYITAKIMGVVNDPGAAKLMAALMRKACAGEEYVPIAEDSRTPKERQQFAKLRAAKLIAYGDIGTYGAKHAKVNWHGLSKALGAQVREAPILRSGYGMEAMF